MVWKMVANQSSGKNFAAEAVARLYSGEMTEAEERNIEAWLRAAPHHRQEFQEMLELWDVAGGLNEEIETSDLGETPSRRGGRRFFFGLAASVLAVAGLTLLMLSIDEPRTQLARYQTTIGEIREIELVDGSHVTLNTNTALLVDFSENKRRIILDQGEAFFEIEKDPFRPLTVAAGDRVITVLGTSFNVNWDGNEVIVAVIEGRVAVQLEGAEESAAERLINLTDATRVSGDSGTLTDGVVLLAGEVAQISRTSEPIFETVVHTTNKYESWRFGYIRFDNEPLSTVIAEINRYSRTRLVIEDADIAGMKVSGVFRTADVDNTISGLELIIPIKVVRSGDHYSIVSANGT